jgi:uncharacterized membrane protein
MRVVFSIIGAVLGLSLATGSRELFGVLLGGFAGFGIAELAALRIKLKELENELAAVRKLAALQPSRAEKQRATADQSTPTEPASGWSAGAPSAARAAPDPTPAQVWPAAADPVEPGATQAGPATSHPTSPQPTSPAPGAWEPYAVAARPSVRASSVTSSSTDSATASGSAPTSSADSGAAGAPSGWGPRDQHSGGAGAIDSILGYIRDYFTGGNTLVRVGVIILFFGVAFLLRYAAEHSHVPIEFRLSGVAFAAVVLLVLGWKLRTRRAGYALALQGGAVGILYLTVFAGLRIYSVLPPAAAFALLVVLAAFSAALAVLQNSQSFAFLAVTGGFLAPILASTGQGNHVVLFSYYAILNAGIVAVAWFKAWRPLNLAGFLFTFVIGTAWGVLSYQAHLFASTEPFLILFFLFYVVIAILFASRQPPELRGYVDGTLVFANPMVAFGLQSGMLHDRRFALAYSALAVSALYLAVATWLHRSRQASQRLLVEAFMALGVLFLTLAVPLALDGRWSAATWALEGAALVWIGCRQDRQLPRAFGALLQIAGGVIFCFDLDAPHGNVPILNSAFLGGVMVSAASVFSAAMLQRHRERLTDFEIAVAPCLFFWGVLWWLFSGLTEIQRRVADQYEAAAGLLLMALTALLSSGLQRRTRMSFARIPPIGLLPAMAVYAGIAVLEVHHPFADAGWISWPLTFAAFYFVCRRHEGEPASVLADSLHVGSAWLLTALVSWEVAWAIDKGVAGGGSWPVIAWALVPAVALFALPRLARPGTWPIGVHREAYTGVAAVGLALYLALWSVKTNVSLPGNPYPLPFVPLLNPLDLAELFVLMVLLRFWLYLRSARLARYADLKEAPVFATLAALTFLWLNAALLRAIHHWAGVPYELQDMLRSTRVETSISIFWTVLALTTMLAATRTGTRVVWLTGAGLLGVVLAKLFLVDLSHVGTIERIVSFVGVGLLMLVIGYFSPLPPAAEGEPEPTQARV